MKKFLVQTVLLLIIISVALVFFSPFGKSAKLDIPFLPQPSQFKSIEINGNKLKVEIADTDSKRNKGLGGRDSLALDEGMLFIYAKASSHPFWMKGMRFPLDFIWINGGKVVDLTLGVLPPVSQAKDADLPIYSSKSEADKILEVNTGVIQKLNIKVGDTIKFQ